MGKKRLRPQTPAEDKTPSQANARNEKATILAMLERAFAISRPKTRPLFPYDKSTHTIKLPSDIEHELFHLAAGGDKVEAIKRVTQLTGAGLRVAKDYVDALVKRR